MFETLNDRGLKTSQADLVKNYLFGQAEDRLGEVQQKWARMKSSLESLEEDDITVTFLRQAMIAIRGHLRDAAFPAKKALYKESPYVLTRQIFKAKEWGPSQINERQKGLAELALKAWPL